MGDGPFVIACTTALFRTVDPMENSYHDLRTGFLVRSSRLRGRAPGLERRIHKILNVLNLEEHSANGQEIKILPSCIPFAGCRL